MKGLVHLALGLGIALATLPGCTRTVAHARLQPIHVAVDRDRFTIETRARLSELDVKIESLRKDVESGVSSVSITTVAWLDEERAVAHATLLRATNASENEWQSIQDALSERLTTVDDAYQAAIDRERR